MHTPRRRFRQRFAGYSSHLCFHHNTEDPVGTGYRVPNLSLLAPLSRELRAPTDAAVNSSSWRSWTIRGNSSRDLDPYHTRSTLIVSCQTLRKQTELILSRLPDPSISRATNDSVPDGLHLPPEQLVVETSCKGTFNTVNVPQVAPKVFVVSVATPHGAKDVCLRHPVRSRLAKPLDNIGPHHIGRKPGSSSAGPGVSTHTFLSSRRARTIPLISGHGPTISR